MHQANQLRELSCSAINCKLFFFTGPPLNPYQGGQSNFNGNLGPPMVNGAGTPSSYSGVNYTTTVPNSMGYSSSGVPPQYPTQSFMPPQLPAGTAHSTGGPAGPAPPQQQYSTGYQNYSPAHGQGQLPPVSGIHPQQVT